MEERTMAAWVALALDAGLHVGEGTRLRVIGAMPHRALMHAVAEGAYRRGASLVRLEYNDPRLARIRVDASRDGHLDEVPLILRREAEVFTAELWSSLLIVGDEDPDAMEGADELRLARVQRARGKAYSALRAAQMSSRFAWCVMPAATDAWAKKALGVAAGADDLWAVLVPILRLDRPDPAAELRAHMESLGTRALALDALRLRELRFEGPGTDLRVALAPESRWVGGADRTPGGAPFMPNIPTEETFSTPDFRGTEGRAALTRPVRILGSLVEGGHLRFEKGRVVEASADRGGAALEGFLGTDEGSRRIGEVALVDSANPIGRSGVVFDSALIDENAACHIALGAGYDPGFDGSAEWSEEEKGSQGFNVSLVHEDLMIGGPEVDVTGVDASGREVALMRRGSFVL